MDATEGGYFETRRRAVPSLEMWRERRQLAREDLARYAGEDVTAGDIERWEAGGEPPTLPQIRGLAQVLGVDPWELSRPPYAWQRPKVPRQR